MTCPALFQRQQDSLHRTLRPYLSTLMLANVDR